MPQTKTAVIIGAGIGGIATAIFLAKKGYSVTVYEKNSGPGGRCGQLIRDGHRFDLGATMLLMPGIYREVFSSLGIDFDTNGTIKKLENLYKIYFDDGCALSFSTDEKKMEAQLESIEAGSFRRSQKYIAKGLSFQTVPEKLIKRKFYSFSEFATFSNILLLFKLKNIFRITET
jgi:phytoene dehydrogenase-like protein